MGCDGQHSLLKEKPLLFQSTQPEWAATDSAWESEKAELRISIHAARVGCDKVAAFGVFFAQGFQSTQPEWAATV